MRLKSSLLAITACIGLTGCAVPFSNYESVTVQTTSGGAAIAGAQCALSNQKGTWMIATPGSVSVHEGSEALDVNCTKDGYMPATQQANSSANMGAILLEGAIASTVSGSAWTYPQMIIVPMQPAAQALNQTPATDPATPPQQKN